MTRRVTHESATWTEEDAERYDTAMAIRDALSAGSTAHLDDQSYERWRRVRRRAEDGFRGLNPADTAAVRDFIERFRGELSLVREDGQ